VRLLLLFVAILFAAPVVAEPVRVTVTQDKEGFVGDFTLPSLAPAWGFWRSSTAAANNQSWRAASWRVLTPGVALQRRGQQDALVSADGGPVPRKVRVRLTPFTGDLNGDYVPALDLGGETLAIFDGHFALYSVDQPDKLDSLPPGFDPALVGDPGTAVQFKSRDVHVVGDVEGYRSGKSSGAYGIFGTLPSVRGDGVDTMIDADLPKWIADYLSGYTPKIIRAFTAGLGPAGLDHPTILAAWEGTGREGASMNGGTLKGLILMRFEGSQAVTELPALRNMARWFVAHEAAHFWLGQAVSYDSPRDSWIMEGGADLLAIRAIAGLDPSFDGRILLNDALRDCVRLGAQPVATALERNQHRAYYACGAVFALVAEGMNGNNFFDFTRRIIDANRADRSVNSADWIAALVRISGKPGLGRTIATFIDRGSADPAGDLAGLLREAGIPFTLNETGVPQL
jgi:hypothetical protein